MADDLVGMVLADDDVAGRVVIEESPGGEEGIGWVIVVDDIFYATVFAPDHRGKKASELSAKTEIRGSMPTHDAAFYAIDDPAAKSASVTFTLPLVELRARWEYAPEEGPSYYAIQSVVPGTSELTAVSAADLAVYDAFTEVVNELDPGLLANKASADLVSTLFYYRNIPPGSIVNQDTRDEQGAESSEAVSGTSGSLCEDFGEVVTARYDLRDQVLVERSFTLGPCRSGNCFGRCGKGCASPPAAWIQRFHQACLDHDACCQAAGGGMACINPFDLDCGDEYAAAALIFNGAPNCNKIEGEWTVAMTGESCLDGDCDTISITEAYTFDSLAVTPQLFVAKDNDPSDDDQYDGRLDREELEGRWRNETSADGCPGLDGYGRGDFTGPVYTCGDDFTVALDGDWPWFYVAPDCEFIGNGPFTGQATATKLTP